MATEPVVEDRRLILNGWERSGGCHENCGACCEYLMIPLDPQYRGELTPREIGWVEWVQAHGIAIIGNKARVPLPCAHLTKDKKCAVYGTDKRPRMCAEGPRLPSEIVGLEEICTYQWRRVNG